MKKIVYNNNIEWESVDLYLAENISVKLTKERYLQLVSELIPEMNDEVQASINRFNKANAMREECFRFIKDIRSIFYDDFDSDDFMFKKNIEKVIENEDQMTEMLEKYSRLLGFE
jgi:hypothetical protein